MRIRESFLPVTTGVLLTVFSGMALASPNPQKQSSAAATKQALPKPQGKAVTGTSRGTITSIDNNRLVLSTKKGGKAEEQTFMLSPTTQRKGDLTAGKVVSVRFRTENNQLTATAIQAAPQKAVSSAKKPAVKKLKKG